MVGKTVFALCPTVGRAHSLDDVSVAAACSLDHQTLDAAPGPLGVLADAAQPPASKPG
jgi:hypothetical protein